MIPEGVRTFAVKAIILAAIAFLLGAGLFVARSFRLATVGPELTLPLIVIGGVLVLLVTLALTAVVFGWMELSDKTQALGLPEGSIRAVIALSLILLFAIVSIFLYSSLSTTGTNIVQTPPLAQQERDQFKAKLPGAQYLYEETRGTDDAMRWVVHYRHIGNPAAEDFSKQLLAILATLVTAVSSFYFGAKTATMAPGGAADQARGAPVIRSVNPTRVVRGTPAKLDLTGDGLDLVKDVKIAFGGRQITATEVLSNASTVTCKLSVDLDAPKGAWDVIVTDGKGGQAKLTGAIEVT